MQYSDIAKELKEMDIAADIERHKSTRGGCDLRTEPERDNDRQREISMLVRPSGRQGRVSDMASFKVRHICGNAA